MVGLMNTKAMRRSQSRFSQLITRPPRGGLGAVSEIVRGQWTQQISCIFAATKYFAVGLYNAAVDPNRDAKVCAT
jgi:hypothetical protein